MTIGVLRSSSATLLLRRVHLLGRGLERLDLLDDELGLAAVLVVDPAAHDHALVDADLRLVRRVGGVEDQHLDLALEVVERREHHRLAGLRADPLGLGDQPADRHPGAVRLRAELGAASSRRARAARRRTSASGWLERKMPSVSFSSREQLDALELLGRHRRVVGRASPAGRAAGASSRSKIEPWPGARPPAPSAPAACACGEHRRASPCAVAPVESSAPHLIRLSIAFLLTVRASTRAQKSQIESNGPPASRASRIFSTAA